MVRATPSVAGETGGMHHESPLRRLWTIAMADGWAEWSSTLIFPLPIDLMRLVDTMRGPGATGEPEPSGR